MKGKNIEEKTEILLKNLRNLISYNDKEKKVIMKCPVCGVEFEDTVYSSYKRMFLSRSLEKTQEEFYNLTCKNRTCINKYGNTELSKNKQRTTNLEKYGVESVFMLDEVKEKSKKAKIEKYGSFSNMIKKNWKRYEEKTGYSHNMRNPHSLKKNKKNRKETINRMTEERKKLWTDRRMNSYLENGTYLFGGVKAKNVSKQQLEFFNLLTNKIEHNIMFGEKEKFVKINDSEFYFLDGYIEELNVVIEYNGDFWHANPLLYKGKDLLKFPNGNVLAEEVWGKNKKRKESIKEKLGCVFLEVWEADFKKNKNKTVDFIVDKIKELDNG